MNENKIEFKNIFKVFGKRPQRGVSFIKKGGSKEQLLEQQKQTLGINNISLSINKNEFFVIMGLSGSGKSTLIRHLNGTY